MSENRLLVCSVLLFFSEDGMKHDRGTLAGKISRVDKRKNDGLQQDCYRGIIKMKDDTEFYG